MQRGAPGCRIRVHNAFERIRVVSWQRLWPEAFPQHGPGRKHERPDRARAWQREIVDEYPWAFLRGLLHSDGCRTINRFKTKLPSGRVAEYAYPRWFFSNLSADIRGLFCATASRSGCAGRSRTTATSRSSHRDSVAVLDEHIGPKT